MDAAFSPITTPDISIIVPIYNTERFFTDCLSSVAAQSYESYEVILANDGSTDGSLLLAENFCRSRSNFHLLSIPHSGVSAALEAGVAAARGKWLVFVDSDDILEPFALRHLVLLRDTYNADLVACGIQTEYNGSVFKKISPAMRGLYVRKDDSKRIHAELLQPSESCLLAILNSRSAKLIRRELVEKNLRYGRGVSFGEDLLVMLGSALDAERFYCDDTVIYRYRLYKISSGARTGYDHHELMYIIIRRIHQIIADKGIADGHDLKTMLRCIDRSLAETQICALYAHAQLTGWAPQEMRRFWKESLSQQRASYAIPLSAAVKIFLLRNGMQGVWEAVHRCKRALFNITLKRK